VTIKELMDRVAGDDLEWYEVESAMLRDMGGDEIEMATLAGIGRDGKTFIFRLPVEKLRRKTRSSL
jgi:hypothetical protein